MTRSREVRDVTAGGVRVRAVLAGAPSHPPLVLVHGFLLDHTSFDDVIDALAESFRVVAPDLPGFGDSEKPSPARFPYDVDRFAEAIADLVAGLELGRVHLLGHAMGGSVALTLAARHPELVHRLVLVDALVYPFPRSLRARLPALPLVGGLVFKQLYGRAMFRSHFRDEVYAPGHTPDAARIDELYDKFNLPAARESAHATLVSLGDLRALGARVGRVRAPTLVLWGREDRLFPVAHASRLVKELADARLEVLPCGHAPPEERPADVVRAVSEFLASPR